MLPSPVVAEVLPVVTAPVDRNVAGRWRGGPATIADSAAVLQPANSSGAGRAVLLAGGCATWPLPPDATCAREARYAFRDAAAGLGLPDDQIYDGMTMASELAANTLHARDNAGSGGVPERPDAGYPELWLYLRYLGGRWELVCKVFDSLADWKGGSAPDLGGSAPQAADRTAVHPGGGAAPHAVGGRGLQVVAALSGGRWGHHLTRSRLGGWKVPGKAVWFAQSVPAGRVPARLWRARPRPGQASRILEAMLVDRGLGDGLLRADEASAQISLLSVRRELTVWCRTDTISWRTWGGSYERRVPTDLEETAEQIVCMCEELDNGRCAGYTGSDRVR